MNSFNTRYGTSGTKLNSCGVCHTSATNPGSRNSYGSAFGNGSYASIEPLDSDGDGFTNLAEITARTWPGLASDFPAGTTAPNMSVSPVTLAFATVNVGTNRAMTATIANTGTASANVNSMTLTGSLDYSLVGAPATPFAVAAGATRVLTVRYTPTGTGADSGSLAITTSDTAHPSLSVALSGTGAANAVAASPSTLSFGAVLVGQSSTLMVTIANSGNASGTVSSIAKSGSADFTLGTGAPATPFTVAAGSSVTVPVVYRPAAAGADSGTLTITSNNPTTPVATIALSGSGNAPAAASLSATPTSLAFGSMAVGTPASLSVTLRNTGSASATVSSLALGGSADFAMASAPATPLTVAAGATVTLSVVYTPSAIGAANGTLTIASNDPANPQIAVALSGTGTASRMVVSPTAVDFGSATVGSTVTRTTTVTNSGNAAGSVTGLSLTGSLDFSLASSNPATPIVVQPNASVTITVTYRPAAAGADSGALQVATDDVKAALTSVALTGSGTAVVVAPNINVNPTSLAFGNVNVGGSKTATTTIQNTGTASLTVSAITVSGAAFSVSTSGPLTVAPGASAAVTVTYAPTSAGASTGALQIASNDPVKPSVAVTLSGSGAQSQIGVSATSLAFGQVNVGASKTLTVRFTNSGGASGTVNSLTLNGSSAFTLNSSVPAMPLTLAAGASADVAVNYMPTAATSDSATLLATTSDAGAPVLSVALTGSGVAQPTGTVSLRASRLSVTSTIYRSGQSVSIRLSVANAGRVNQPRPATIVGTRNGTEIYRQSQSVFAPVGGNSVNFQFPAYTPTQSGTIYWRATIQNSATSSSTATARTSVSLPSSDDDDEHDDEHDDD
ncbi:MAG: choice-of-anchor D domain-containing protein [Verrucomicrobia bacterium]|nr:choice-of-anchor D domain-containing protein [Verrucomicrobiota bacterium]